MHPEHLIGQAVGPIVIKDFPYIIYTPYCIRENMKIKYRCHNSETSLHNLPHERQGIYFTRNGIHRPPVGGGFFGTIGKYLLLSRIGRHRYCSHKGLILD